MSLVLSFLLLSVYYSLPSNKTAMLQPVVEIEKYEEKGKGVVQLNPFKIPG